MAWGSAGGAGTGASNASARASCYGYGMVVKGADVEQPSFRAWFGAEPEEIVRSLREFTRSCEVAEELGLIDRYPEKWIGVHNGTIRATADQLDSLLEELDRLGVPRRETAIRYLTKNRRKLILHDAVR